MAEPQIFGSVGFNNLQGIPEQIGSILGAGGGSFAIEPTSGIGLILLQYGDYIMAGFGMLFAVMAWMAYDGYKALSDEI